MDLLNVRHTVAPVRLRGVVYLLNSAELLWAAVIRAGAAATLPSLPSVFWGVPSSERFSAGLHLTTSPMHGCNLRFLFLFPTAAAQIVEKKKYIIISGVVLFFKFFVVCNVAASIQTHLQLCHALACILRVCKYWLYLHWKKKRYPSTRTVLTIYLMANAQPNIMHRKIYRRVVEMTGLVICSIAVIVEKQAIHLNA